MGLSNEEFGWVLGAFALAYALFEIPSGILGDRIGPRKVFIRIVLWWSLFTALTGMVNGLVALLIVRFLFGVGETGTYPNTNIVVSRWFPTNEMGRTLSWVGIGSQIGSAIAPLIIVPLAVAYGWRTPFFVNAGIGLVWVLICYSWFRNFPSEMKHISPGEKQYIESNRQYDQNQHRLPWRLVLRNRQLLALLLMYFCCQWAQYFFVAWMPIYLQEGRHFSENAMKDITFILFIIGIIGFLVGGYTGDILVKKKGLRFGRRFIGIAGLGTCGLMILGAALVTGKYAAAICLIGANFGFAFGVMVSYAVCADIGRNNCGTVTGAMNFFGQMGAFLLAIIFGKIADATHGFQVPMLVLAFVLICGALLWLGIDPKKQIREV
jgi:ACS family glucarate transporter-like MFS transporter